MVDATDAAAHKFAAARNKLKKLAGVDKGIRATKGRARDINAQAPASKLQREPKSGRTELWGIRCKPEVKATCRAIAEERGIDYSAWAEEAFRAAIAAHTAKKANGGAHA
jgi:hypothetical protein